MPTRIVAHAGLSFDGRTIQKKLPTNCDTVIGQGDTVILNIELEGEPYTIVIRIQAEEADWRLK